MHSPNAQPLSYLLLCCHACKGEPLPPLTASANCSWDPSCIYCTSLKKQTQFVTKCSPLVLLKASHSQKLQTSLARSGDKATHFIPGSENQFQVTRCAEKLGYLILLLQDIVVKISIPSDQSNRCGTSTTVLCALMFDVQVAIHVGLEIQHMSICIQPGELDLR